VLAAIQASGFGSGGSPAVGLRIAAVAGVSFVYWLWRFKRVSFFADHRGLTRIAPEGRTTIAWQDVVSYRIVGPECCRYGVVTARRRRIIFWWGIWNGNPLSEAIVERLSERDQ
jgi:hypothetical protein